jgi:hypothetical protein
MPKHIEIRNYLIKERWAIGLMLFFGLIHGLVYVFTVPPWQHYDEPGHFEHAWLIANRTNLPQEGDFDQNMRRELAASMIENGFFDGLDFRPNLISITEPVWIGISQLNDPHAYYWFVALPLRLIQTTDITFQLYVARLVSLIFYIITIAIGYAIARELAGPKHPIRWLVPLTMALIPGFTDVMTAINNDIGATTFFSIFLWLSVRTIRKGPHWLRFAGLLSIAILCFFTKNTVAFALLLTPIPIILSLLSRGKQRRVAWATIAVAIGIGLLFAILPGEPAYWYDNDPASNAGRFKTGDAHGQYAFRLRSKQDGNQSQLAQPLPAEIKTSLSGKIVTVGGWAWANQPIDITSPILTSDAQSNSVTLHVNTYPQFFSFTTALEPNTNKLRLVLPSSSSTQTISTIYFDGLILVEGDWTLSGEPSFTNREGSQGTWGGASFNNLLRNGSAERPWIGLRRTVGQRLGSFYPGSLFTIITALGDWQGSKWYFDGTFDNLFRTFWAKFGWGHISLLGSKPYRPLVFVTALGVVAALIAAWVYRYKLPRSEVTFLLFAGLLVWGGAFFRGIDSLFGTTFIPSARYACPAIIPTVAIFAFGWFAIGKWLQQRLKISAMLLFLVYIAAFAVLDVWSIWSIMHFYHP